jgi:predicted dehydrogenase
MPEKVKVGLIGCGAISGAYLDHGKNFPILDFAACADMNRAAAEAKAQEYGIPRVLSVEELLADRSIELVLNLTVPKAHAPVALAAINAGKHTYAEKPLAITREDGRRIVDAAKSKGVLVGCAPDTFMGAGIQTARKVVDSGRIGRPVGFTAFMLCKGHEHWHPSPEFYYEVGGGPVFDMAPYYLTALMNLLGPVSRLTSQASIQIPERTITSQPKNGKKVKVETPDHVMGTMSFAGGAIGLLGMSFAVPFATHNGQQPISVFGTEGTVAVPDPNQFDGVVRMRRVDDADWHDVPHEFPTGYGRAVGLADMAYAIRTGRPFRASGEQALHVLDVMQGLLESSNDARAYDVKTPYQRPAPMPVGLPFGQLD